MRSLLYQDLSWTRVNSKSLEMLITSDADCIRSPVKDSQLMQDQLVASKSFR